MSRIREFFESLQTEADILGLIDRKREEDHHVEFKRKTDPLIADLTKNDAAHFSKALSGFANAAGGLVIWGIGTYKAEGGIDRAGSHHPLQMHDAFRARLIDSLLNATQPVVDDVVVQSITAASGGGYVKCWIPASDRPPHRAMLASREYWRRGPGSHRRMEHDELEDVFGRRLRPVLRMRVNFRPRPDPDPHGELHFHMLNEGRGVARHAGLFCKLVGVRVAGASGSIQDVSYLNAGSPTVDCYDPVGVVHPNGIWRALGTAIVVPTGENPEVTLALKWYAEEAEPKAAEITIRPGETATT